MIRLERPMLASALALLLATPALAFNPGTDSRAAATASTGGSTTICEGGTAAGTPCMDSSVCTGGGSCTGIVDVNVVARGTLTIVADTQPLNNGWDDVSYPATCSEPAADGVISDCENKDNSLLTLILEFTFNGERYSFAEVWKQLPDGGSCGSPPCDFVIDNWPTSGGNQAGWSQPAVESIIAEVAGFQNDVVKIRWGGLSPAVENAVGAAFGKTASQRIALSRTDEVPTCTDVTHCNNDRFSDHSGGTDVLATLRRYKVDIAVIGP